MIYFYYIKKYFLDQSIQKNILFKFEKGSTGSNIRFTLQTSSSMSSFTNEVKWAMSREPVLQAMMPRAGQIGILHVNYCTFGYKFGPTDMSSSDNARTALHVGLIP